MRGIASAEKRLAMTGLRLCPVIAVVLCEAIPRVRTQDGYIQGSSAEGP